MAKYNFDKSLDNGRYIVEIDSAAKYGYFQNLKSGTVGGLWFDAEMALVDYDGCTELSKQVITLIEEMGFNADYAKDGES